MHIPESQTLRYRVQLLEAELHASQRQQQALIAALDRTRAEIAALEGGIEFFHDGEALLHG